jgi:CheY-like chemotaxis protein
VRHTVVEILKSLGCEPHEAEDGQAAIDLLQQQPVDVIILDLHMPVKDGFETLEELRADSRFAELPVFILTSSSEHSFVRKAAALNIAGYLLKSELNPRDLAARIGSIVGRIVAVSPPKQAESLNLKILLVHSPAGDHREIIKVLADWGCTIMPTDDSEESLVLARQGDVDIALVEDELAASDGFSVVKQLRAASDEAAGKAMPIVLVSDKPLDQIKDLGVRAGMDAYVAKPIDEQRLFKTLKDLSALALSTATLFDRAELMERAGDEVELVQRMLELYFRDAPILMEQAHQAIADQDGKALGDHAHTLKGMLATLAAHEIARYAELLERIGRSDDLSKARMAVDKLQSEMSNLSEQFKTEFKS